MNFNNTNNNLEKRFDKLDPQSLLNDIYYNFNSSRKEYYYNNWNEFINRDRIFYTLKKNGVGLWLNIKGEICYRLTSTEKIHTAPMSKVSLVLSNFLDNPSFEITKNRNSNRNSIDLNSLLLVSDEIFDPYEKREFFQMRNLIFRNTFDPTNYIYNTPKRKDKLEYSIILEYLCHLSNYDKGKLVYLINWLSSFFRDLSKKSHFALVLLGSEESGKEILFDEIITPLFGSKYTTKVTNDLVKSKVFTKSIKDKLFYCLDNISKKNIEKSNKGQSIKDLILKDNIYLENRESYENISIYAQTLITINDPEMLLFNKNDTYYSVFKVSDNIKISKIFDDDNISSKETLISHISEDLENFSLFLKLYDVDPEIINKPCQNDDKFEIQNSSNDNIEVFVEAILKMDKTFFKSIEKVDLNLYEDVISDFNEFRIKQTNLYKCFNIVCKDTTISSSKGLMIKLREINENFFKKESIISKKGGIKYYPIK